MRVLLLALLLIASLPAEDLPPALAEPIAAYKAATKKTPKDQALTALKKAIEAMGSGVEAHQARLVTELEALMLAAGGTGDTTHRLGNVAQALARQSAASRPGLRQWLTRKEPAARYIALQVASEVADPASLPAFAAEIGKGADPEVAALAAGRVNHLLADEAVRAEVADLLVAAARHKHPKVRVAAVAALPVPQFRERDWFVALRPRFAEAAATALADKDASVRCAAAESWPETLAGGQSPTDAQVKAYLALAKDADAGVVAVVAFHASVLARSATAAQRATITAAIAALTKHADETVRQQATMAQEQLAQ